MTAVVRIEGTQLQITRAGESGPTLRLSIEDWRALNRTVEATIDDSYVSYDDAVTRLGIHRSTLGDWIAQGKLERVLIGGRGYVSATSLSAATSKEPRSERHSTESKPVIAAPASNPSFPRPENQFSETSPRRLSPTAWTLVHELTNREKAIEPARFPADPAEAKRPGMYSWWGDDEACAVLGEAIGVKLPHLLYVGQAGATRWPSGAKSAATLASRIGTQHIRGNARSSTFRLTISSLLIEPLSLTTAGGGKLDPASNERTSAWIADHLRIAIAPFDDRDTLGRLEKEVVGQLDPPLNLEHCPPSQARTRITQRRGAIGRGRT